MKSSQSSHFQQYRETNVLKALVITSVKGKLTEKTSETSYSTTRIAAWESSSMNCSSSDYYACGELYPGYREQRYLRSIWIGRGRSAVLDNPTSVKIKWLRSMTMYLCFCLYFLFSNQYASTPSLQINLCRYCDLSFGCTVTQIQSVSTTFWQI